jgi:hypothetical protein
VVASALVLPDPVDAAGGNSGGEAYITAEVQFGRPPSSGGAGRDASGCTWTPAEYAINEGGNIVVDRVDGGVAFHLFIRSCPDRVVSVWVPQRAPASLAAEGRARIEELLDAPAVMSAPPTGKGVVKVGMWFWTDPGAFVAHEVTAWLPTPSGVVWATTRARPVGLEFDSGEPDGATARCAGPGDVWTRADGDDAVSECMYTYRHSSSIAPAGVFESSLSIVWEITWSSSTGASGASPPLRTTTTTPVTVNEIQALVN